MKKFISLFLLVAVIALSGCSNKTAYEQMVDDLGNVQKMQYSMGEIGISSNDINLNYYVEMDSKTPLVHVNVLGMDMYLNDTTLYIKALDNWFSGELTDEIKADLEDDLNFDYFTIDMPDGDETISVDTGIESLDNAVNGKTYNEVVVATDNGFSITGLEDLLSITAGDETLSIEFGDSEGNSLHATFGKTEKFELPKEAEEATEIPTAALQQLYA